MAKKRKERLVSSSRKEWLVILGLIFGAIGAIAGLVYLIDYSSSSSQYPRYIEFPVHVSAGEKYDLRPIYVKENQRFHFNWTVWKGGAVTVGFVTPVGDFFGFDEGSNSLKRDLHKPLMSGSAAFRPQEYDWGTGWYVVRIEAPSETADINVGFWVD